MNQNLYSQFLRFPLIIRLLLISFIIMTLFGTVIHLIEPGSFPTVFDGIWWAIVTSSTVGFGDYVPKTVVGRVTGMFLILLGVSFFTYYVAHLATAAVEKQNEFVEGKSAYKGTDHFIIIGWNELARDIIAALTRMDSKKQIILIDETLERIPPKHGNIHFIRGRANNDDTLIKANVKEAECVIITADPNKDEQQADMHTILTLLAVKGLYPKMNCIVEILMSEQVMNARRAGADKIIETNKLMSSVILNRLQSPLSEVLFNEFIHFNQNWLEYIPVSEEAFDTEFRDACMDFFSKRRILVGIIREENSYINPPHDFRLQRGDQLLVIRKS